jgi:hypothetical protein
VTVADDLKYGRITTEKKAIPDDEPVLLFRGQDIFTPLVAQVYLNILAQHHMENTALAAIMERGLLRLKAWQEAHPERLKIPD